VSSRVNSVASRGDELMRFFARSLTPLTRSDASARL
jgi:hypothetical protein